MKTNKKVPNHQPYIYIYLKPDKEIKESGHIATKGLHEPSNPAVAKVNLNPSARA